MNERKHEPVAEIKHGKSVTITIEQTIRFTPRTPESKMPGLRVSPEKKQEGAKE